MYESTAQVATLLGIVGLGLALGKVSWRGFSLGTSAVVFVALAAGHFGFEVPRIAGVAGVVLFVYCLGIGAGPNFLRLILMRGRVLALLAASMILSASAATWAVSRLLGLSPSLASGLFSGALTSTPAFAAATERLSGETEVAVGFGIAYPLGVVGVILFAQVSRRWMFPASSASSVIEDAKAVEIDPITRVLIDVKNPGVVGRRIRDVATIAQANCQVSRFLVNGRMQPIPATFQLEQGQRVLVVGPERRIAEVVEVLGEPCEEVNYVLDLERQRRRVVVTSAEVVGKSLRELHLLSRFGVTVSRITRRDIEFVPSSQESIQFGDALTAVGEPHELDRFVEFAGHRERTLDETNLISLALALLLGIAVGRIEFTLGDTSLSLGLAGGPLLVGLIVGHFGHLGPIVGRMPRAARFLLSDIGLALFLAQAGSQAGSEFVSVIRSHGLALPLAAAAIVTVPIIVGVLLARFVGGLSPLETSGGICGAMTSTPGLGAITSAVDSSVPAATYAAIYPLALILITLLTPMLIELML